MIVLFAKIYPVLNMLYVYHLPLPNRPIRPKKLLGLPRLSILADLAHQVLIDLNS